MSEKQTYITLMGRSGWAVVNSFHATIIETEYRPSQIYIIYEREYAKDVEPVVDGLEIVQSSYTAPNVQGIEVPDEDAHAAGKAVFALVNQLRGDGFQIALDITGGRKAPVTGSLLYLRKSPPERIYYLGIKTTEDAAKPYLMIPRRIQRLRDFITNEVQNEKTGLDPATGDNDLRLSRDCIMVLLNQSYARGENIVVKAPLVGVELLEVDLQSQKVVMRTNKTQYEQRRNANEGEGSELPDYDDLKRGLCYCGILEYENEVEFRDLLVKDLSRIFDQRRTERRAYLSLDTCMFRSGFPSTLARFEKSLQIQPKDVICVTSYAVRKEVEKEFGGKYRMADIEAAKSHYKESHLRTLFAEFLGQNKLKTRKAKMGKSQFVHFTKRPVHMMTGDDDMVLPRDNEEIDSIIVQSLKKFARERSVRVILVSSDKLILDKCDLAEDVYPLILRLPPSIPRTMKGTDSIFVDLLVSLSLLYGVLELERIGHLFGEYRGKQSEVYMDEVKLRVHNLQRAKVLQERVDTCRKLKELNIAT